MFFSLAEQTLNSFTHVTMKDGPQAGTVLGTDGERFIWINSAIGTVVTASTALGDFLPYVWI